jgi:hypothetical protein
MPTPSGDQIWAIWRKTSANLTSRAILDRVTKIAIAGYRGPDGHNSARLHRTVAADSDSSWARPRSSNRHSWVGGRPGSRLRAGTQRSRGVTRELMGLSMVLATIEWTDSVSYETCRVLSLRNGRSILEIGDLNGVERRSEWFPSSVDALRQAKQWCRQHHTSEPYIAA